MNLSWNVWKLYFISGTFSAASAASSQHQDKEENNTTGSAEAEEPGVTSGSMSPGLQVLE